MPTYDYKCMDCGYIFEEFQGINEPPLQTCPKCSGKIKRLIGGGSGFLFKGNGFYITDYRSDNYKSKHKQEKTPTKPKESSPKTDPKPVNSNNKQNKSNKKE